METLAANWEGEWTTCSCSHPGGQHAEPSCCFNSAPGEEVFEPSQLIISQLPAHSSVDQFLMEYGLVGDHQHQALWSLPSCISSTRFQPHPHDSFKKRKRDGYPASSGTLNFQLQGGTRGDVDAEAIQQMKEMMYRAAALRPVNLGAEMVEKPRRKNVRISSDPQTVAARQRRERLSERLRVLQKLVPGGCKMDTASMLDEAANYLKFLRSQVQALEAMPPAAPPPTTSASISSSPSLNSHISANQLITPDVGTFNLPNCFQFPAAYYNNSSSNDNRNDDDDDDRGGRISMISYHPIPIPNIPTAAAMRHNPTSNPPFLLQQYTKS